jgi:hypothetical protein
VTTSYATVCLKLAANASHNAVSTLPARNCRSPRADSRAAAASLGSLPASPPIVVAVVDDVADGGGGGNDGAGAADRAALTRARASSKYSLYAVSDASLPKRMQFQRKHAPVVAYLSAGNSRKNASTAVGGVSRSACASTLGVAISARCNRGTRRRTSTDTITSRLCMLSSAVSNRNDARPHDSILSNAQSNNKMIVSRVRLSHFELTRRATALNSSESDADASSSFGSPSHQACVFRRQSHHVHTENQCQHRGSQRATRDEDCVCQTNTIIRLHTHTRAMPAARCVTAVDARSSALSNAGPCDHATPHRHRLRAIKYQ